MFTDNQTAILRFLADAPDQAFTMSELGRWLGKAPGVFQRGLNALEQAGYIVSRRRANLRLLSYNAAHPAQEAVRAIVQRAASPLPADVYMTYARSAPAGELEIAEPLGQYEASARKILIIAGPNGAGKTTFAREFLLQEAKCPIFINADYIAHGLSPFMPEVAAIKAGKVMLRELAHHLAYGHSVAVETTLSGRRYARLIPRWQEMGYAVKVIFLSLPSVELAVARVAMRVKQGGHAIPESTIRRRFEVGWRNFRTVYKPLVDAWALYDSSCQLPCLIEECET